MRLELEHLQIQIKGLLEEREEITVLSEKAFNSYNSMEQRQKVFEEQNMSLTQKLQLERQNSKLLESRNAELEFIIENNKQAAVMMNLTSLKKRKARIAFIII
jgi:hypothetical protein